MSIIRVLLLCLILHSCKQIKPQPSPFEGMTQNKKDSLAEEYKQLSYYYIQPSKAHRIAKDTAIILNPNNIENIQVLSYSYKKSGEHIEAMRILNKAVDMDVKKGSTDALEYRAWSLLYFYRDYEGTITDVDQIFKMKNKAYNVCWGEPCGFLKGQAQYKLEAYQDAIETLNIVLSEEKKMGFNPDNNYLTHFYIGRCYHQLRDFGNAQKHYDIVLKYSENITEAWYQSAWIQLEIGNKKLAQEHLLKAQKLLKNNNKMGEPYFERFDECFMYQVDAALAKL